MKENFPQEERLVASDDFDGPIRDRRCTDVLFAVLFLAAFMCMNAIGMAAIGVYPSQYIQVGNPQRLLSGVDYQGALCGVDPAVINLPKKWRPNTSGTNLDSENTMVPPLFGICVSTCPQEGESREDPYGQYGYWTAPVSTTSIIGYCLPIDTKRAENMAENMFADFIRAGVPIAVIGFVFATVSSVLFLVTIRLPMVLRTIVWGCISIIMLVLSVGGYVFLNKAKKEEGMMGPEAQSMAEVALLKALGWTCVLTAVFWLSVICFMRERIALAIGIVREAAKALSAMPLLCFFPLFHTVLFTGFSVLWMVYSVYLVSSGDMTTHVDDLTGIAYKTITYDTHSQQALAFMFFCWLWVTGFLEAVGQIASSHAVLVWYFSPDRGQIGSGQVFRSTWVTMRYHSGTAALGSFIISIVQFARLCLEYIKQKLAVRQNCLIRYFVCMLSCCLWCFERVLQFLTKHAYVQCALFGSPFCQSARRAFGLILRNIGRVSVVAVVGDFVVLIGKMSITLCSAALGYYFMDTYLSDQLSGLVLPTVLVGYIAFCTATLFLSVVSATCNTILQAFIAEEEMETAHAAGHDVSLGSTMKQLKVCFEHDGLREYELTSSTSQGPGDLEMVNAESGQVGNPVRASGSNPFDDDVDDESRDMVTQPSHTSAATVPAGPRHFSWSSDSAPGNSNNSNRYSHQKQSPGSGPAKPPKPASSRYAVGSASKTPPPLKPLKSATPQRVDHVGADV